MRSIVIRSIVLGVVLFMPLISSASTLTKVEIEYMSINRGLDQVFIRASTSPVDQGLIGCHTDSNWNYTFKLKDSATNPTSNTETNSAVYSSLLAAFISKRKVTIVGAGNCTNLNYGKVEDVSYVNIY